MQSKSQINHQSFASESTFIIFVIIKAKTKTLALKTQCQHDESNADDDYKDYTPHWSSTSSYQ